MNNINITFNNPLILLLLIPMFGLALYPYFRLNKNYRKTRNRVVSMAIHLVILTLITLVLSGFKVNKDQVFIKDEVFILIDYSRSSEANKELIDDKVRGVITVMDPEYRVGIIGFGDEPLMIQNLSSNQESVLNNYLNYDDSNLIKDATNIEKALNFARDNFTKPNLGRIIIITDGRETDGSALKGAHDLASLGIRVDVIYLPSVQKREEVQIVNVLMPNNISRNTPVNIMVEVESMEPSNAVIKIYDNGELINESGFNVNLNGSLDIFSFDHSFFTGGVHEIKVEIKKDGDFILENNVYYTFADVDGKNNRVLIIDGTGNESSLLENLINDDLDTDVIGLNELNNNIEIINLYDEIILMNVSNSDLSLGFDALLKDYVEKLGGSVLNVGGNKAYQESDMKGTLFESIMPVFASTDSKSMAVILVIDKSGSMITHGSEKLELAKQGAIDSVNALNDNDYVGVIIFDANPVLLVEPTPVSRKDEIIDAIRTIEAGQGTFYTGGIQLAKNQLDNFPGNERFSKHVIFLTDGYPQDSGYMEVIAQYGDISLSTIAIGDDHGIDYDIVENMVKVVEGRGNFYKVVDEYELPDIMEIETLSVSSDFLNEVDFEPLVYTRIPSVANIINLPELNGYYGARLKEGATLVLTKESDPIYAEWDYGKGKVGSFLSDLSGHYSTEYFTDPRGHILLKGIINGLLPDEVINSYDVHAKFIKDNFTTNVQVTSVFNEGEEVIMEVTNPLGETINIDLYRQTLNTLTSNFETKIPGLYQILITKLDANNNVISTHKTYTTFSYSKEYDAFYNDSEVFNYMKELTEYGNGDILFELDNIFSLESQTEQINHDPSLILFIMALILFLIDIITRKFKFKWPHEWFKNKENLN